MWDLYESLAEAKRAELLREVFESIVLTSDGIAGFALRSPFNELASAAKGDPRKLSLNERNRLLGTILDAA
jgi:hypothetical protein